MICLVQSLDSYFPFLTSLSRANVLHQSRYLVTVRLLKVLSFSLLFSVWDDVLIRKAVCEALCTRLLVTHSQRNECLKAMTKELRLIRYVCEIRYW